MRRCLLSGGIETIAGRRQTAFCAETTNRPFGGFGSNCDLQHPLKHRRLSARNETFGAECRQSVRNRTFTSVPLESAEVEFVLQTRGLDHVQQLISALSQASYKVHELLV